MTKIIEFDDDTILEGYDRVTQVIAPFTGIEFVEEELLNHAADRGTRSHQAIEAFFHGFDLKVMDEDVEPRFRAAKNFWEKSHLSANNLEIIIERRLTCRELKITGKIDLIVKANGRYYPVDWKTSSKESKAWRLQGAAYKYLMQQAGFKNPDDVLFVKLDKHGKFTTYKYDDYEENFRIFKQCLELYRWFEMKHTRKKR